MSAAPALRSKPVGYEVEDLVALSKIAPRRGMQIFRIAAGSVLIMLGVVLLGEVWMPGLMDWTSVLTLLVASILILAISSPRGRAWISLRLTRRSPLYAPHSFELLPGAIRVSSPKFSSDIPWTTVCEMKLVDGRLFVFITKQLAYIVPRRAFETEPEFDAFVEAAKEHWEGRHRL